MEEWGLYSVKKKAKQTQAFYILAAFRLQYWKISYQYMLATCWTHSLKNNLKFSFV